MTDMGPAPEVTLAGVALIADTLAFLKTSSLSFNPAPVTFLDDCLLVIPIPFFFVNTALNVIAEIFHASGSGYRAGVLLLQLLQVLLQTPMLIDGLRRSTFSPKQRYKKPGRELVTFLIIINLAMWVVFTFELKKADTLVAAPKFFGERWLYIGHTTVPLMLFYRFHSAVCFADIWKSAYEKEED
ncbi:proton channel OtopLc-like [Galendromus occidentalis]|uniref:Proton channel OtopLc-like n=1 Tax=Galendromus occidentalis TaxID=34638 RepID=A0AAJ6VW99_9ACAR|nr:proton channel OtopLc-like [Galendromus occidentalis]